MAEKEKDRIRISVSIDVPDDLMKEFNVDTEDLKDAGIEATKIVFKYFCGYVANKQIKKLELNYFS